MTVWLVQAGYRMDYQVMGAFATHELAKRDQERRTNELTENHRLNPSWEYTVVSLEVQGVAAVSESHD